MTAVEAPVRATPEQARTLLMASLATLLVLVTFVTPLATGVRTTVDLAAGPGAQAWLLSAMSVGLAAALLTAGVLADDLGRRRVFAGGLAVVGAGAVVVAAASSPGVFIAGRLLQGVGGAAVLACALGLIGHAFPPGPARSRAAAVWGASVGAGTGLGGLVTVALDHGQGWRTTYWATAAAALLLAAVARWTLAESGGNADRRVDVAGIVLLAGGISALLAGLVQSRTGWGQLPVVVLLALGVLLLAAFVPAELRQAAPMIDLRLFRIPGFLAATVGAFVTGATVVGLSSYVPTVLQRGLGESLLTATLLVLVWSAVSTVTALSVRFLPGLDGRVLLALALAVCAVGLGGYAVLGVDASGARLLPGLVVLGIGYGAANAALGREAVAHVPAARAGMGSGANNTARYLGAAIGVTLVVLVVGAGDPAGTTEGLLAGWDRAALGGAVVTLLGALVVAVIRPARTP
ncbi:Transmembrane efflux protein [Modestobacter italicus]|uniref:Transmembrane efflux protein n=1 Tax=Modestobacter italicus (strain DSM 44449 / CECT 9708 / BC 501) TaxID=2732864 RepID=I4EQ71_MODI5|nr:MFS transporter [Modestobacter marinus]CCH85534.1 Transmembrane efflux protein [Modestobacter marinus]